MPPLQWQVTRASASGVVLKPNLPGGDIDPTTSLAVLVAVLVVIFGAMAATAKPESKEPRGVFGALGMATRVFVQNLGPLGILAALVGGTGSVLSAWVGGAAHDWWMQTHANAGQQAQLMSSELPNSIVVLFWGCTVGSFSVAYSLYWWVRHEKGETGDIYAGINFALNRLPRVFSAHASAYFLIWLGNIVVIPGIWFALQYAFVDAIATLDDREQAPLDRSQRLTYGRRGRIFRTFAMAAIWMVPYQLPLRLDFQGKGMGYVFLGGTIDEAIGILLTFAFVQYYLDIFRKPKTEAPAAG